jgi:hypothetical protein
VDFLAHFVMGLWFYKETGMLETILLSISFDLDHIVGYFYDRRKQTNINIPSVFRLAYRPRSWFHSFTGLILIALPAIFIFRLPVRVVLFPLVVHLLLDVIDKSGIYILPPFVKKKIHGILPVGFLLEDPDRLKRHKQSHIPSLILIVVIVVLSLLNIV